jgi:hypothetical protein
MHAIFFSREVLMELKQIRYYIANWRASENVGNFEFIYKGGQKAKTIDLEPASFSVIIDILRYEKPVFGDHTTGTVMTAEEPVGEEES